MRTNTAKNRGPPEFFILFRGFINPTLRLIIQELVDQTILICKARSGKQPWRIHQQHFHRQCASNQNKALQDLKSNMPFCKNRYIQTSCYKILAWNIHDIFGPSKPQFVICIHLNLCDLLTLFDASQR